MAKVFLRNNRTGDITLSAFKLYYKTIVIKTEWYWNQKQTHGTEKSPVINPCIYDQLILGKGAKNTKQRKGSHFKKWFWENWMFTVKQYN